MKENPRNTPKTAPKRCIIDRIFIRSGGLATGFAFPYKSMGYGRSTGCESFLSGRKSGRIRSNPVAIRSGKNYLNSLILNGFLWFSTVSDRIPIRSVDTLRPDSFPPPVRGGNPVGSLGRSVGRSVGFEIIQKKEGSE